MKIFQCALFLTKLNRINDKYCSVKNRLNFALKMDCLCLSRKDQLEL